MNKLTDENLIKVWLLARDVSEAALVAGYTSPQHSIYADRVLRVEERLTELMKLLGVEDKANG